MSQRDWIDKPASIWEVPDLEQLALAEEGPYLEFKKPSEFIKAGQFSWDTFSEEVSETASAFLNADGGVLLIGVQTNKAPGDGRTESLKPVEDWTPDQTFEHLNVSLTSSQIRDRVYGNIVPRPYGIEVNTLDVTVGDMQTRIFVVTVPASVLGAHQSARTHRYYRRTSDGDVPMLDYEIKDVNNRRGGPLLNLECAVSLDETTIPEDDWKASRTALKQMDDRGTRFYYVNVVLALKNLGRGTANYVKVDVGIPHSWQVYAYSPRGTDVGAHWVTHSPAQYLLGTRATVFWRPEKCHEARPLLQRRSMGISEQQITWHTAIYNGNNAPAHPIWPMAGRVLVGELGLRRQEGGDGSWWLPWRIFTEGMPEIRGAVLLRVAGPLVVNNYEADNISWCGEAEDEQWFSTLKDRFVIT
jgi:hypothetical protein